MKNLFYNLENDFLKKINTLLFTSFLVITTIVTCKEFFMFNGGFFQKSINIDDLEEEKLSFSKRNFYEYLKKNNIKFPEIVFAQAMKESGLKSNLFKNNNNPFGMKKARKRPNMQNGVKNGHANYESWRHAIIDYGMYQSYIGVDKIKTEEDYLRFLKKKKYFDVNHPNNVNYLKDLKKIAHNIDRYIKD